MITDQDINAGIAILFGIAILIIFIGLIFRNVNEPVIVKCWWCGKKFEMSSREYKRHKQYNAEIFCSGRCQRSYEMTNNVKEKRIRYLNHE